MCRIIKRITLCLAVVFLFHIGAALATAQTEMADGGTADSNLLAAAVERLYAEGIYGIAIFPETFSAATDAMPAKEWIGQGKEKILHAVHGLLMTAENFGTEWRLNIQFMDRDGK